MNLLVNVLKAFWIAFVAALLLGFSLDFAAFALRVAADFHTSGSRCLAIAATYYPTAVGTGCASSLRCFAFLFAPVLGALCLAPNGRTGLESRALWLVIGVSLGLAVSAVAFTAL
jgi:hypothetical protein